MEPNPYKAPRAESIPAMPRRRRTLRDWITLVVLVVVGAPILYCLELAAVYILQWFGVDVG